MSTIDDLIGILKSPDVSPEEKISSIISIGKSKNIRALEHIVALLDDENPDVKSAAVYAIGKYKDEEQIPKLIPLLKDPNENVRAATIKTLSKFSGHKLLDTILQLLDDDDPEIRKKILEAIVNFDASIERVVEKIVETLEKDDDTGVKIKAIELLGEYINKSAVATKKLIETLETTDDFELQMAVIDQLSKIDPIIKEFLMLSLKGRKKLFIEDPLTPEEMGVDLAYRRKQPLVMRIRSFKEEVDTLKKYIQFLLQQGQLVEE